MYSYTAWPKKNRKSNRQGQKTRAQKRPKKYKVKKRKIMSMKIKENRWKTSFFEPPGKVDWKKVQRRKRASKIHQVRNGLNVQVIEVNMRSYTARQKKRSIKPAREKSGAKNDQKNTKYKKTPQDSSNENHRK